MPFPADVVVLLRHRPSEPDRTTTLSGEKRRRRVPSATPWDDVPERDLNPAERAAMRSGRSVYDFRHHGFEGDAEFCNGYPRDSCPAGRPRTSCASASGWTTRAGPRPSTRGSAAPTAAWSGKRSARAGSLAARRSRTITTSSHLALIRELVLVDIRINASKLKGVPDELNPLQPVNRMRFFLKAFLESRSRFKRNRMQGYLDLLHVAMNEPEDKLEKVAMVLDRAMRCRKTIRFRDFYRRKPSSSNCAEQV